MKKEGKNSAVVAAERKEAAELAADILRITATIPPHIVNTPGVMFSRDFKARMVKARLLASAMTKDLYKLRAAMQDVKHYYRTN